MSIAARLGSVAFWRSRSCVATPARIHPDDAIGEGQIMNEGEITNLQRAVLQALMCGKTDGKIAAELYVGRRTMHRWLKKLMEEAGATNRFALGAHAARNGWLEERDNHTGRTALPLVNMETPDGDGATLVNWSSRPPT
jgi:hypothetical protein